MAQLKAESITSTHTRYTFTQNIVVDVKLMELSPGMSGLRTWMNGLEFDMLVHPVPKISQYPRDADLRTALEGWQTAIYDNPMGVQS